MKRIFAAFCVFIIVMTFLTSCAEKQDIDLKLPVFATIETTEEKSYLNYYNATADILSSVEIDIPALGTYSKPAIYTQNKAFLIAEGDLQESKTDTVVMIDMESKKATALSLSFPSIYAMCAQGDIVYTITGENYVSTLTRFDTVTGEKKEFDLDGFGMNFVYANGDTVYLVESEMGEDSFSTLYLLDEGTLEVKKTYDVKKYLYSVNDIKEFNGVLYIAPLTKLTEQGDEAFVNTLVCFDLEKEEFNEIAMQSQYPCQNILPYDDGLVISHTNPILFEGQDITVYNLTANKFRTKTADSPTAHLQIKDNRLYQLSEEKITVFDLSKANFPKLKTVDNCIRDGYKTTTFFAF